MIDYVPYGNGLLQITARHFCAGVVVEAGWVSRQAPIVNYMHHWTWRAVQSYCRKKGWQCELVKENR